MKEWQLLENKGVAFLGDKEKIFTDEKVFIVVGVARGGTSLVSGVLHHLGVFTGDLSSSPVYEDVRLAGALEKEERSEAEKIIQEYGSRHNTWAFKRPAVIRYLDTLHGLCNNPVYLFIFKDILAVANRNTISMKAELLQSLSSAHEAYGIILDFLQHNDINGVCFSYEKIMADREYFVNCLKGLMPALDISETQVKAAVDFIERNPKKYLDASRITKSEGTIDKITFNYIGGWARMLHVETPAEVELYVNDKLIQRVKADRFREDLLEKNIHKDGKCAYHFILAEENHFQSEDIIRVRVAGDVEDLKNSPVQYKG